MKSALLAMGGVLAVAPAYFVIDKFWISRHVTQEKPVATTSLPPCGWDSSAACAL
jgi:hypothetical protein